MLILNSNWTLKLRDFTQKADEKIKYGRIKPSVSGRIQADG
jgi:hypothetical protein